MVVAVVSAGWYGLVVLMDVSFLFSSLSSFLFAFVFYAFLSVLWHVLMHDIKSPSSGKLCKMN